MTSPFNKSATFTARPPREVSLYFRSHIETGLTHRFDNLVKGDAAQTVAPQRQ
jgi:hypothetical protein